MKILTSLLVVFSLSTSAFAAQPPSWLNKPKKPKAATAAGDLVSGSAVYTHGGKAMSLTDVRGDIKKTGQMTMATLGFYQAGGSNRLQLNFAYQGPGKVKPQFIMVLFAQTEEVGNSMYKLPPKSECTVTLTKATMKEVAGTAHCPKMANEDGVPGAPTVENVRFEAKAK